MRKGTLNCGRKIWNLTCFTGRSAAACWSEEEMASSSTWTFSSSDFLDEGSALPVLDLLSEDSSGTWATSNGVEPCFWTFSATDLSSPFVANGTQVWSLTQPYSVGVLQSRTSSKERGFFYKYAIKVFISCVFLRCSPNFWKKRTRRGCADMAPFKGPALRQGTSD